VRRKVGDVVVAGSRITQGQLRGSCTWSGDERALARPMLNAARRADVHADVPRWTRRFAERWSPLVAVVAGAVFLALGRDALDVGMLMVAVYAACANLVVGSLPGLAVASGVRAALSRGVVYNDANAWVTCAKVTVAVFCARGTLLRGEPELVEAECFGSGDATPNDVLALAAGTLAGERDPAAIAVRRAAKVRGVVADAVRNPRSYSGAGVTAVAGTGEGLCVGSRALMVERRISVAAAEKRIYELEASGRTVVLVAKAGRLVGLLGLQDGLRSGARAAVQHLMDAKIEPVLMSSDTRETCEALGRALDIDHLRPEVFEDQRAAAVERIRDTGGRVAVLGHTPFDDEALAAANASVALAAAGRERDDFAVWMVSDDVRDAALALALAHATRRQATTMALLTLGPVALGVLVTTLALLPPEYAPLAQLVGAFAAVFQLRGFERAE
jgi:P-type E1-E2 ATPase